MTLCTCFLKTGAGAARDALGSILPLACYASKQLWSSAVRVVARAEEDLARFESAYKEKVGRLQG